MSGKDKASQGINPKTAPLQSLKGSISDNSLTGPETITESSPQSFAALKQAYDFMLPQFKTLQTDKRSLQKENEELKKILIEREGQGVEMSDNFHGIFPDDLQSKGQSTRRIPAALTPEDQIENGDRENGDIFQASPCSAMDSAINLNDGNESLERSVREERVKWVKFCMLLLVQLPEEKLCNLTNDNEHCLDCLDNYVLNESQPDQDILISKLSQIRGFRGTVADKIHLQTSQIATPVIVGSSEVSNRVQACKYDEGLSEDEPSDEDIYTSGLPSRMRSRRKFDEDSEGEMVRVDNAMDVFARCAYFIQQSLEVNSALVKKLQEKQQMDIQGRSTKAIKLKGSLPTSSPQHRPPVKPSRLGPIPRNVLNEPLIYHKQFDHVRNPSTAHSDPGRISNMSHLNLESQLYSDPSASGWNPLPKTRGRPLSEADLQAPLHEVAVKFPPSQYDSGRRYKAMDYREDRPLPQPPADQFSQITIDHNFQFGDLTYQPCGPPETNFKYQDEEEEEVISWNAARNPDMYEDFAPRRVAGSDPMKHFSPKDDRSGINADSYSHGQLPRSSDRIYDKRSGRDELPGNIQFRSQGSHLTKAAKPKSKSVNCPVCQKIFDPETPEVAINSHVNLHFEDEPRDFEVIE